MIEWYVDNHVITITNTNYHYQHYHYQHYHVITNHEVTF